MRVSFTPGKPCRATQLTQGSRLVRETDAATVNRPAVHGPCSLYLRGGLFVSGFLKVEDPPPSYSLFAGPALILVAVSANWSSSNFGNTPPLGMPACEAWTD